MLNTATRVGITEAEFWDMSLRSFARIVRVYSEKEKAAHDERWWHTAVVSSYIINSVGGAAAGRKWKGITPKQIFDKLTGKQVEKGAKERIKAAKASHHATLEKQKPKLVSW